jgi:hypothetical protein
MGKLCSLSRHTTFLLSAIAGLQGKVVKMQVNMLIHCSWALSFLPSFSAIYARSVDQTTLELL